MSQCSEVQFILGSQAIQAYTAVKSILETVCGVSCPTCLLKRKQILQQLDRFSKIVSEC